MATLVGDGLAVRGGPQVAEHAAEQSGVGVHDQVGAVPHSGDCRRALGRELVTSTGSKLTGIRPRDADAVSSTSRMCSDRRLRASESRSSESVTCVLGHVALGQHHRPARGHRHGGAQLVREGCQEAVALAGLVGVGLVGDHRGPGDEEVAHPAMQERGLDVPLVRHVVDRPAGQHGEHHGDAQVHRGLGRDARVGLVGGAPVRHQLRACSLRRLGHGASLGPGVPPLGEPSSPQPRE